MTFWRSFSWNTASAIDSILEKENFTLEELLNEDDILTELKAQNKNLTQFLSEPETLEKLMNYVVEEPEESGDEKRFKYPYLCAEILACDNWSICDGLFQNVHLLEKLFGFLDNPAPLNPLLTSYFNKVSSYVLLKRCRETIDILKKKENVLSRFMEHINNPSIVDLLLKIVACDETDSEHTILTWLCDAGIITSMVAKLSKENSSDVHENVAQALCDMITISLQSPNAALFSGSPLLKQLEETENVETLIQNILSDGPKSSSLLYGIGVLIDLVRRNASETYDDTRSIENLPSVLQVLSGRIEDFKQLITYEDDDQMRTTYGALNPPFGFYRMKVLELFAAFAGTRYISLLKLGLDKGVFALCFDLFFKYPWNNFLHNFVTQIAHYLLDCQNEDIIEELLSTTNLHGKISASSSCVGENGQRPGYMGFVTIISGALQNAADAHSKVKELLAQSEEWKKYEMSELAETRRIENKPYGSMGVDDEVADDDSKPMEFFSNYQLTAKKGFETDFPEDFTSGESEEDDRDIMFHPDNRIFAGINTDEEGFGDEFDQEASSGTEDEAEGVAA